MAENYEPKIYADFINNVVPIFEIRNELSTDYPRYLSFLSAGKRNLALEIKINSEIRSLFSRLETFSRVQKIEEKDEIMSFKDAYELIYSTISETEVKVRPFTFGEMKKLYIFLNNAIFVSGIGDIEFKKTDFSKTNALRGNIQNG